MSGSGMLVVWMNIAPAQEADFDGWFTREHIPERVGVPGFRNGSRYEAIAGNPRFLSVYDTDGPQVLVSDPYRERLNDPTPWTQRVMLAFRDTVRVACRLLGEEGRGVGGYLRTLRIEPAAGRREALRAALSGPLLRKIYEQPRIARVRAAEGDLPGAAAQSGETSIRGPDRSASFVLLMDGTDAGAIGAAAAALLSEAQLGELGAAPGAAVGDYRLLYTLGK
jgi:hypothetical protein